MLTLSAFAKINLVLEVLSKRADGYHQISSILQTISIFDELSFETSSDLVFSSDDQDDLSNSFIETSVMNSALLMQKETGCRKGAAIRLRRKGIPRAAGLGSSSSVPATVLKGLNHIWALDLSDDQLREIAARLGSDTPFFIAGGTALAEGRGEVVNSLRPVYPMWLVLMAPKAEPIRDKTSKMYSLLTEEQFTSGELTRSLVTELELGQAVDSSKYYNAFEAPASKYYPFLESLKQSFIECGAKHVHLAGSGPALFTLVADKQKGESISSRLKQKGFAPLLAQTIQVNQVSLVHQIG